MKLLRELEYKGEKYTIEVNDTQVLGTIRGMTFEATPKNGCEFSRYVSEMDYSLKRSIAGVDLDVQTYLMDLGFKPIEMDLTVKGRIVDPNIYYTKDDEVEYPRDSMDPEKGLIKNSKSFYDRVRVMSMQNTMDKDSEQVNRFKLGIEEVAREGKFKVKFSEKLRSYTRSCFELMGFEVEYDRDPRAPKPKITISWKE